MGVRYAAASCAQAPRPDWLRVPSPTAPGREGLSGIVVQIHNFNGRARLEDVNRGEEKPICGQGPEYFRYA